MADFVLLHPNCYRLKDHSKGFNDAYVFAKQLTSLVHHPILLNFRANKRAYTTILKMGHIRFEKLLKAAIAHKLAYYEGDHLRLTSKTHDKKQFNIKRGKFEQVRPSEIKAYICAQILKKSIKSQTYKIKETAAAEKLASGYSANHSQQPIIDHLKNTVTMSSRTLGKLLHLSHTSALKALTKANAFGLTAKTNTVRISPADMAYFAKLYPIRLDKKTGDFYFLGANIISYSKQSTFTKPTYSFYNNDTE